MIEAYFADLLRAVAAFPHAVSSNLTLRSSDSNTGLVKGALHLAGGYRLHVAEYVVMEPQLRPLSYRYHLQDAQHTLVCRWDDAPHYPDLPTCPHHCHLADGSVVACEAMDLPAVLRAALRLMD